MTPALTPADLQHLFAGVAQGAAPLVALTDEEVAALLDVCPDPVPDLPWIRGRDDLTLETAADVGARSLLVRGLVRGSGSTRQVDPALRVAVEAPRIAAARVEVTAPDGSSGRLVAIPGLGVVEHHTGATGFHLFTACTAAEAGARFAAQWIADVDPVPADLPGRTIDLSSWSRLVESEVGPSASSLEVSAWTPDRPGGSTWVIAHGPRAAMTCRRVRDASALVHLVDRTALARAVTGALTLDQPSHRPEAARTGEPVTPLG